MDIDKYLEQTDEIARKRAEISRLQNLVPGMRVRGNMVIRRLPNGRTDIESLSSFLDRFPRLRGGG